MPAIPEKLTQISQPRSGRKRIVRGDNVTWPYLGGVWSGNRFGDELLVCSVNLELNRAISTRSQFKEITALRRTRKWY